ncbi:hypothetical protein MMC14_002893 [Varicellaria rhodocarpa]|nr:hypothetical protein [Varicellaria rhodocarpa]
MATTPTSTPTHAQVQVQAPESAPVPAAYAQTTLTSVPDPIPVPVPVPVFDSEPVLSSPSGPLLLLPRITIRYCTQCKWMLRAAYIWGFVSLEGSRKRADLDLFVDATGVIGPSFVFEIAETA